MKKLFSSILILGTMMISSCSSEEPFDGNQSATDAQVTNYLTVNIVPSITPTTRGDGDDVNGGKSGNYVDGTGSEQQVNNIRFFFFDKDGNGAPVSVITSDTGSTPVSYIDWEHVDNDLGDGIPDETVSATLTATLGLVIPDGYENPTSLIAVINPSTAVTSIAANPNTFGPTMAQVQGLSADLVTDLTDGNFVMSNSVYANTSGNTPSTVNSTSLVVNTTQGEVPYFQSSIEAAQANPVTVYVERVAARLDLKIGIDGATANGYYPVMKKVEGGEDMQVSIDVDGDGTEDLIYVKFLGWNVTSTPDKTNLIKNIVPTWTSAQLFGTTSNLLWNSMDYHRSFWAMNPNGVAYRYGNFGNASGKEVDGNVQPAQANEMPATGQFATTYMMENASQYNGTLLNPTNPTQVIVAAQLVTENGAAVPLAEWGYKKYTQTGLLNYLVANVISNGHYYKKTDTGYVSLMPGDLKFVSASQYYPGGLPTNVERYYSYIMLNTDATTQWYQWNGEGDAPAADNVVPVQPSVIDSYILNNVGYTMMWNTGYAYYYFDVRHLGETASPAFYGVVRNHIYEATVSGLYGFGTPVCNPDEIIIPEAPKYEEVLLAAEIRILQWRVVSADYVFDWR